MSSVAGDTRKGTCFWETKTQFSTEIEDCRRGYGVDVRDTSSVGGVVYFVISECRVVQSDSVHVQGSAKRSADFVKQQPGRARQKS